MNLDGSAAFRIGASCLRALKIRVSVVRFRPGHHQIKKLVRAGTCCAGALTPDSAAEIGVYQIQAPAEPRA